MAEFRTVHSKMWRDSWFTELDIDGKLLWVYLITNQAASLTGIYHLSVKFAAFETGLSQERINTLLAQFVLSGKIEYENEIVWVRRMRRYQAQNESSPKIKPRIVKDLDEVPDCKIKRMYIEAYDTDTVSSDIDRTSIPTHTDTDTDTDTETDKTLPGASAPAEKQAPQDLSFSQTPSGAILGQKLAATFASKNRRPPKGYANGPQRDAFQEVFGKLGQKLPALLDQAMQADITDRARLLRWLEGCAKKNGHGPGEASGDKLAQASELTRERLAKYGESW